MNLEMTQEEKDKIYAIIAMLLLLLFARIKYGPDFMVTP